jgi:hypothetical protein
MHPTGDMFSDARRVLSSLMTAVCELENHRIFIMVYFVNFLIEEIIMVYHPFYHRRVSGR